MRFAVVARVYLCLRRRRGEARLGEAREGKGRGKANMQGARWFFFHFFPFPPGCGKGEAFLYDF